MREQPEKATEVAVPASMPVSRDWPSELRKRRDAVTEFLVGHDCDVALVFGSPDHSETCRYLTGFVPVLGDVYGLLARDGSSKWMTNFHWQLAEARQRSGLREWQAEFVLEPLVIEEVLDARPRRMGVVGLQRLPHVIVSEMLRAAPQLEFVDLGPSVDRLRRRKTAFEMSILGEAVRVTDAAIDALRAEVRVGATERALAAHVGATINARGAALAFPSVVMSGAECDDIIRMPTDRAIRPGDSVMVDVGAAVDGYQADLARTFVVGPVTAAQRRAWDTLLRVREGLLRLARPGTRCSDLHHYALTNLSDAGYELRHRIGHGYGLATSFEWPSLDTESALLEPGMTLAIEPSVYGPGVGAMKCEDDVVITERGCEVLSQASTELTIGQ